MANIKAVIKVQDLFMTPWIYPPFSLKMDICDFEDGRKKWYDVFTAVVLYTVQIMQCMTYIPSRASSLDLALDGTMHATCVKQSIQPNIGHNFIVYFSYYVKKYKNPIHTSFQSIAIDHRGDIQLRSVSWRNNTPI